MSGGPIVSATGTGWCVNASRDWVHDLEDCYDDPQHTPVLVVDLAGAREQIARTVIDRCRHTASVVNEGVGCPICNETIGALLAALGAPEEERAKAVRWLDTQPPVRVHGEDHPR